MTLCFAQGLNSISWIVLDWIGEEERERERSVMPFGLSDSIRTSNIDAEQLLGGWITIWCG